MSKHLDIDPKVGDVICQLIKKLHGVDVDIILITTPLGDWEHPSFVTSLSPDVMEAVVMQIGEHFQDGVGKRTIHRTHTTPGQ